MDEEKRLDGRVAVVTGAGRGIGRGYVRLLAQQGAKVVVNDLGTDSEPPEVAEVTAAEINADGGIAVADGHDVSSWSGAKNLIDTALTSFGQLDILVCNAGILRDRVLATMTEADLDDVIRVNLKGVFAPVHHAVAQWRQKSKDTGEMVDGRIILTTSEAGLYGNASQTNYAAAKAGVASMGVAAARELRRYGITVNTIAPRARTRLTEETFGEFGDTEGFDYWDPDNVAPWVVYLCTPAARKISGQTFVVGGGRVELMEGWSRANVVEQQARWELSQLDQVASDLFGSRKTVPPRFPDMGLPQSLAMDAKT